jgi:hypothetical protein
MAALEAAIQSNNCLFTICGWPGQARP